MAKKKKPMKDRVDITIKATLDDGEVVCDATVEQCSDWGSGVCWSDDLEEALNQIPLDTTGVTIVARRVGVEPVEPVVQETAHPITAPVETLAEPGVPVDPTDDTVPVEEPIHFQTARMAVEPPVTALSEDSTSGPQTPPSE